MLIHSLRHWRRSIRRYTDLHIHVAFASFFVGLCWPLGLYTVILLARGVL